jgi:hypothetical protein
MTCYCGDTSCPSCGPAQGFDPAFERVCEWLDFVLADNLEALDLYDVDGDPAWIDWIVEAIADAIGRQAPQSVLDAMDDAARAWARERSQR